MTNDEQNALRALLREEVNAAVYASEQRKGERLNRLEGGQRELRLDVARIEVQLPETIENAPEDCLHNPGRWMVLDFLHDMWYDIEHETETRLQV